MPRARSKSKNLSHSFQFALVFLLLAALVIAISLAARSQDIRNRAAYTGTAKDCTDSFSVDFANNPSATNSGRFDFSHASIDSSGLLMKIDYANMAKNATFMPKAPYQGDIDVETTIESFSPEFKTGEESKSVGPQFRIGDQAAVKFFIVATPKNKKLYFQQMSNQVFVNKATVDLPAFPIRLRMIRSGSVVYGFLRKADGSYQKIGETDSIFTNPVTVPIVLAQTPFTDPTSINQAKIRSFMLRCLDSAARALVTPAVPKTTPTPTPTPVVKRPADRRSFVIQAFYDNNGNRRLDTQEKGATTTLYFDRNKEDYWREYKTYESDQGKGGEFSEVKGGDVIRVRRNPPPYDSAFDEKTFIVAGTTSKTTAQFVLAVKPTPVPTPRVVSVAASPLPKPTPVVIPSPTPTPTPFAFPSPTPIVVVSVSPSPVAMVTPSPVITPTPTPTSTPVPDTTEPNFITQAFRNIYCFFARCEQN